LTLAFEKLSHLPTLSWCARVERGSHTTVRHGSGVETRHDGFVEGAWDGDFDAFDFDKVKTLAGTGGRLRHDTMVFAAPFHPLERLFVLREPGKVLVSNSLVFLLTEVNDQLDISYPNYFFDLLAMARRGIVASPTRLCTAGGREVELYPCCNLELDSKLNICRVDKPLGAPPADYADYFGLLLATTRALTENAAAPQRTAKYQLVAACSTGYDSTAAAAIASLTGYEEGVTYVGSTEVSGTRISGVAVVQGDDSGAAALRALGMTVTEYVRTDVASLTGHPRAEFFVSPVSSTDASTRIMEDQLRVSIFVSGRHGGRYWGTSRRYSRVNFTEVDERHLSVHGLREFRLRVGFVNLPLPYIGALHGAAIYRITHSDEMLPW
jgi:rhodanese-related sulfurtransferase